MNYRENFKFANFTSMKSNDIWTVAIVFLFSIVTVDHGNLKKFKWNIMEYRLYTKGEEVLEQTRSSWAYNRFIGR